MLIFTNGQFLSHKCVAMKILIFRTIDLFFEKSVKMGPKKYENDFCENYSNFLKEQV